VDEYIENNMKKYQRNMKANLWILGIEEGEEVQIKNIRTTFSKIKSPERHADQGTGGI
jgi:hypothetical protein